MLSTVKNKISDIPVVSQFIDDCKDLPYKPPDPLPTKSFALYVCGAPGSGKTSLWMSLLLSHPTKKHKDRPKYMYKLFDRVELISASLNTLPKSILNKIPENQQHLDYSDDLLQELIDEMREDENLNNLIILDDNIKNLNKSKILAKVYLNRRHCTYDKDQEGTASLSIITTSQKYNLLALQFRVAQSDVILFKSSNNTEIKTIKDELMNDLTPELQDKVLELAWKEPYSFLYIKVNQPLHKKYYVKFDLIKFD